MVLSALLLDSSAAAPAHDALAVRCAVVRRACRSAGRCTDPEPPHLGTFLLTRYVADGRDAAACVHRNRVADVPHPN